MPKETIIDNDYCSMWYYADKKIVHHQIHKFIFGQAFYDFLLTGTALIQNNHAKKWLSDDRHVPVLRAEDIEWGAANWFPQTQKAGWKFWAIVQPEKAVGKMTMQALLERYAKLGITAKFFTDLDEAMKWLESQN